MAEQPAKKQGVHWLIKSWFCFHVFMIFSRSIPLPNPDEQAMGNATIGTAIKNFNAQVIRNPKYGGPYYTESLGFWQYWDMFAPNPAQEDIWLDAEVTYADGSTKIYEYPRMKSMGLFEKFLKERYRKYVERLNSEAYTWKWPHTAHWVAARAWDDPQNPPVKVALRRHFQRILPPPAPLPTAYEEATFYTAAIDRQRMEALR